MNKWKAVGAAPVLEWTELRDMRGFYEAFQTLESLLSGNMWR